MHSTQIAERRYDIDWLRVFAIGLLVIYHIGIVFQPWATYIMFIGSKESLESIWPPMALLNIWRIPLLFFVSGMGAYFASRKRNWKQLIAERSKRILVPLLFGIFFIVPIHIYLFQNFYNLESSYTPGFGHLWFLYNIIFYFVCFIGLLIYFPQSPNNMFLKSLRWIIKKPGGLYLFTLPFIIESTITDPQFFTVWYEGFHSFLYGMFSFLLGLCFVAMGNEFWEKVSKLKFLSLGFAVTLFFVRYLVFDFQTPHYLTSFESINWIFAVFGFGYAYFNRPSKALSYLSPAVYPIYIIHMAFQYLACYLIIPLAISVWLKLFFIIIFTFASSFIVYELLIKRVKYIRLLFGLKV